MSRVSCLPLAAALAVAATPALSADIYGGGAAAPAAGYEYQPAPVAPAWSGAYAGAQVGFSFGKVQNRVRPASVKNTGAQGATGGIYGGVNAQVGPNFVVGAEADINASSLEGTTVHGTRAVKGDSDWNGTVRGRVGVAMGRVMPYATGGIAFVDQGVRTSFGSDSETKVGWAAGAGVEGAITDRITGKLEYMYLGTGEAELRVRTRRIDTDQSNNVIRAGVGYKF